MVNLCCTQGLRCLQVLLPLIVWPPTLVSCMSLAHDCLS